MTYHDIDPADIESLLERDGLIVIDMRDPQTRTLGMLPNAQESSDALMMQLMRQRKTNPPVLVYCYKGNASRDLCSFIAQMGLTDVYNLTGGWAAWLNHNRAAGPAPGIALPDLHLRWLHTEGFDLKDVLGSRVGMGMTALMQAALKGERAIVTSLLDAGADVNAVNDDNHQALWFACVSGDGAIVQTLIEAGADLNNRNVNGITCAMYSASAGKLDALTALADAGADLDLETPDGFKAVDLAATFPVLRYLRPKVA